MSGNFLQDMCDLRSQLLNEKIDAAYAALGERPLSNEETERLIASCVEAVEAATYPQAQPLQQGRAAQW
jgi:hypothetical protein